MSGGFMVPFSSSPPSTPDNRLRVPKGKTADPYSLYGSEPSTTPAGPPPSSTNSFTPAGPPPTSFLGSSHLGSGKSLFPSKPPKLAQDTLGLHNKPRVSSGSYTAPSSRQQQVPLNDVGNPIVLDDDDDEEEGEDGSQDENMEEEGDDNGAGYGQYTSNDRRLGLSPQSDDFRSSAPFDWAALAQDSRSSPAKNFKRSYGGLGVSHQSQPENRIAKRKSSTIPTIARKLARQFGQPALDEPDKLILETEEQIKKLYDEEVDTDRKLEEVLTEVPQALCRSWEAIVNQTKQDVVMDQEYTVLIGPSDEDPSFHNAVFLGNLMLKLHHPRVVKRSFVDGLPKIEAIPWMLLSWLIAHHNPYKGVLSSLRSYEPNATAHVDYWNIVCAATVRGDIADVIRVFQGSEFQYAQTAEIDGQRSQGYQRDQLSSIKTAINGAISVLESCPGLTEANWHVTGNDWAVFRKRVEKAISELSSFAEGRDADFDPSSSAISEAKNFGLKKPSSALSRSARKAGSKVPWTIYTNLKTFYGILLGGATELLSFAQDWVEATIALTIWWNGDDDDEIAATSLATTRKAIRSSYAQSERSVDVNPISAYLRRLAYAYDRVTGDAAFVINSNHPMEIGLASLFEGDVEGVLGLLQGWSIPVASAITEIATVAQWYEAPPGDAHGNGFDESDLMVLSYGQPEKGLSKDGILVTYAELLFERDPIPKPHSRGETIEGWELSLEVLKRLDDELLAGRKVAALLDQMSVESDHRADKLINICRSFNLDGPACEIAEKYATYAAENTDAYGTALIYYARAHNPKKVKDVLDLLVSFCLVQSYAYPPIAEVDPHLSSLLLKPRQSIKRLSESDMGAAEILSVQFSGYATLRKFYDLRDQEVNGVEVTLRPVARKKAALAALMTVIASAGDSIQGGLYDEKIESIIPVDGLLNLLGEASIFVDQEPSLLTISQALAILRAVEDLQIIHPRIQSQCDECLSSALASAHGAAAPDPKDLLKKSISELTASSGFSLVGSSMLSGNSKGKGGDGRSRGWDWRASVHKNEKGEDILAKLRMGLAKEVAKSWVQGENV